MQRLLIIGGGYAGFWAAAAAAREADARGAELAITLVSRDGYLVNRPRLYEAHSEALRTPITPILEAIGVAFRAGRARAIDCRARTVSVADGDGNETALGYDRLVLAAGSQLRDLPIPGAAIHAWNIDSFDAARALEDHLRRVLTTPDHGTLVIIGAGFTGIELATEMRARIAALSDAEIARAARIVLVDRNAVVGRELGANPRPYIERALRAANVELRLAAEVAGIEADGVTFGDGARIATRTVVVTAGMRANPLAEALPVETDALGRLPTDATLRVVGVDGVFAAGDIARAYVDDTHLALMSCQHSMTMGRFAGHNAARDMLGLPLTPYRQPRYVTCLDLGASGALFTNGWDREVETHGAEAKSRKRLIVTESIVPPTGGRADILGAAALES